MPVEATRFIDAKMIAGSIPESKAPVLDWQALERLAAPPPPSWSRRLAQALFSCGGIRTAEALGRHVEFCRVPGNDASYINRATQPRFAILCYHRVGCGGIPIYSGLPPAVFAAQMRYLRKHYRIVSLDEVIREIEAPVNADPGVAITFDDGYADVYTQALPILQQYGIPATIFLTVGSIESGEVAWYDKVFLAFQLVQATEFELPVKPSRRVPLGTPKQRLLAAVEFISTMKKVSVIERRASCAQLESSVKLPEKNLANRMLTWKQIRRMQAAGIFFGSHTMTHPVVSQLNDEQLCWELEESKRIVEERLQRPVLDFAFPFGKSDECGEAAVAHLMRMGYRSAVTTVADLNRPLANPFALCRVSFGEERSLAMFALRLARLFLVRESHFAGAKSFYVRSENTAKAVNDPRTFVGSDNA